MILLKENIFFQEGKKKITSYGFLVKNLCTKRQISKPHWEKAKGKNHSRLNLSLTPAELAIKTFVHRIWKPLRVTFTSSRVAKWKSVSDVCGVWGTGIHRTCVSRSDGLSLASAEKQQRSFPPAHNAADRNQTFFVSSGVTKRFCKRHSRLGDSCIWGLCGTLHPFILDFHFAPWTQVKFSKTRQPNFRNLNWFQTIILSQIQTVTNFRAFSGANVNLVPQ